MDAPASKPFVHCVALISPSVTALGTGALGRDTQSPGVRVLRASMRRGYVGPAPIKGHGPHRYIFQVFALGHALDADAAARSAPRDLLESVDSPVLARGRVTGSFER